VGLFRTLVGLVVAWMVFRALDRLFGRGRGAGRRPRGESGGRNAAGFGGRGGPDAPGAKAKDDHLGEYVDYEEVEGDD
jgi:hypothetical protein